jgi:hypothetical protein
VENNNITDSQKLDIIEKRLRRMEVSTHIHTAVVIIGFLGIISLGAMLGKIKKVIK